MAITDPGVWRSLVNAAVTELTRRKAKDQDLDPDVLRKMRFRCEAKYDLMSSSTLFRLQWNDPDPPYTARGVNTMVDDDSMAQDVRLREMMVGGLVDNLDIRGELFFFKLHKHFPKHLKEVKCVRPGSLVVAFKNGRTLDTPEDLLESKEFLATCAMVFDL